MRGWIVGLIATVVAIVAVSVAAVVVLAPSGSIALADLEVGDCFVLPDVDARSGEVAAELGAIEVISCDDPHDAEVVLVGELDPRGERPYPDDPTLLAEADDRCRAADVDASRFGVLPVAPDEATWASFRGRVACLAVPYGGGPVTGSAIRGAASS